MKIILLQTLKLLVELEKDWILNRLTLNYSRIPVGFIALGIARDVMEHAIESTKTHSFGRKKLIEYQEIQMQIGDMLILKSAYRMMIWQYSSNWKAHQSWSSMVRFFNYDFAIRVNKTAMDILSNYNTYHNICKKTF